MCYWLLQELAKRHRRMRPAGHRGRRAYHHQHQRHDDAQKMLTTLAKSTYSAPPAGTTLRTLRGRSRAPGNRAADCDMVAVR